MLSAEDKKRSTGYKQVRVEMIEMFTAKNNIERIFCEDAYRNCKHHSPFPP